ncbi:MAG: CHAT domain-containing protein, partial [Cyclobacteriaceae bacterium]|nr:CHAT domain-containing protein [Cyclobacteriaceae bacterium]
LAYYDKELELRLRLDPTGEGSSDINNLIYSIASINAEIGNYSKAEKMYLDLLEKDLAAGGKKAEDFVSTLLALADHYTLTREAEKGDRLLKKYGGSIKKNTYDEAMSLRFRGDYYEIQGEFSKAEASYTRALVILEETGYYPSLEYVYIMNALGLLYTNKSQYPIAEEIYKQSLDILGRLSDEDEESKAGINFNLAQVYVELGLFDAALDLYLQILESDKDYYGSESFYVATTSFVIGGIYAETGRYAESEKYLLNAIRIFDKIGETESLEYAFTLNNLMRLYTLKNDFAHAFDYAEKSLNKYRSIVGEEHYEYAKTLSNASDIYQKYGNLDKAETYLAQADKIREKKLGNTHPQYALSTRKLAILNWKKQNLESALSYYQKTFDNYFAQINTYFPILSEEEKSKFYYNKLKPTFEQFNSFIVENRGEDKQLIGLMYNYQLATKGLILYATNKVKQSILSSGDSILIAKYDTWIGQKEQLAHLFSASEMDPDKRSKQIDSLTIAANELEGDLSKLSSVFAQSFASKDLTWQDVKAKLKPGEAAVEIIRFRDFDPDSAGIYTDEVYYAALIVTSQTEEAPDLVIMRNGHQMETRYLNNYRNAIRYRVSENFSYRMFWRPIANRLQGIKKVYFSPDGVYNQISIYTLQNPDTKLYTIDEFDIQLVTNTKDLVAFNYDIQSDFSNPSSLFGFPNYNMGAIDAQQKGNEKNTASGSENAQTPGENRGARGGRGAEPAEGFEELVRSGGIPRGLRGNMLRYMRSNQLLALLPGTQKEVTLIDSLYTRKNVETHLYLSDDAIEERIKDVSNPQTLHIATHGFFLEQEHDSNMGETDKYVANPLLRSGLILAGANSFISTGEIGAEVVLKDDGILTAFEAMNLNLDNTELVVLSACETGLGEVQNGEGVFGLQRAFQVAGADAIIMSMWSVDDNATQELMTNFYEEWLTSGNKHLAFIAAQKKLKDKWKSPFYWGAFVMIGN